MKQTLSIILLTLAALMQAMGGWMDILGVDKVTHISKTHLWTDALFLVLLTIAINLVH